ncbi:MAG: hypothetical protein KGN00_04910 [Chloroflexota bacterium]|nr:hypothetical protein [Chloroflexota bacterium]
MFGGDRVNWIETLLGIDPDLGTGSLETLIVGAVVLVIAGLVISRAARTGERSH